MLQRIFRHVLPGRQNRAATPNRLRLESLESRIVLTASPGTASLEGSVLRICGTDAAETIIVAELQNDFFVAADFLSESLFFPKDQVTSVIVDAGDGNDTIVATSTTSGVSLRGEAGNDRIFGGSGDDVIQGGTGEDLIYGNGGDDTIFGGDDNDLIFAGLGDDLVLGNLGDDTIIGMGGEDTLNGNDGDDKLSGSAGNDIVRGDAGADQLLGGAGDDEVFGGDDDDTVVGDGDHDELYGGAGDDTLLGSGGNDHLEGGTGEDRLVGSLGEDNLLGGDGRDELFGDDGNDELHGNGEEDMLFAGKGRDLLFGNDGPDIMRGGDGDDVLIGGDGVDNLHAGDGKDIVVGGGGGDVLRGDGNEDFLVPGTLLITSNDALNAMSTDWTSTESFENRVARVLHRVTPDVATPNEFLFGNLGRDAFFIDDPSRVFDLAANESLTTDNRTVANDLYNAAIGETIVISANDGVLANDPFPRESVDHAVATITTQPSHGTVTFNDDGSFSFTMDGHGRDFFRYDVTTAYGNSTEARVDIVVPGLPLMPQGASLTTTASGLQYYDFEVGAGANPTSSSNVTVDYVGYLPNGQIFDSNDDITFNLQQLIDGFSEGTVGMQSGGTRRMVIPPDLGYGASGNPGAGIGGTDTIVFDVTLDSFV